MALAKWPIAPDPWLEPWTIWRIGDGKAATRPADAPAKIPAYANEFLLWTLWRRRGRPPPRPDILAKIPAWAYPILDHVNAKVPIALPDHPDVWLLSWAIWRFRNSPPDRKPAGLPDDVSVAAPYCWSFLKWAAWRRKNPMPPRPADIPPVIPSWAFTLLRQINQAVPVGPAPPPPPPPPPPLPPSSWTLPNPIMFTSWGWRDDAQYRDNDEALQRMKQAGVKTVALQIGQYLPGDPARVRAYGMKVALWGRADSNDQEALTTAHADGYIAQIEGQYEYEDAIRNLEAGVGEGLSLSVVTTLAGLQTFIRLPPTTAHPEGKLTTVETERLIQAGVTHAWVECYIQDGGVHFPIANMMWAAAQRGLDYANPLIGLYHETPVDAYRPPTDPGSLDSYGKQIGAYLSEGMTPQNWIDFARLGT